MIKPITKFPAVVYAIRSSSAHGQPSRIEILHVTKHKEDLKKSYSSYVFNFGFVIYFKFKAKRLRPSYWLDKAVEESFKYISSMSNKTKTKVFYNIFDSYDRTN